MSERQDRGTVNVETYFTFSDLHLWTKKNILPSKTWVSERQDRGTVNVETYFTFSDLHLWTKKNILLSKTWVSEWQERGTVIVETYFKFSDLHLWAKKMDALLSKTWLWAGHDRGTVTVETVFAYHNFHSQGLCLVLTYFQRLKTGLLRSEDWSTFMDSATPGHIYMLICQKIGRVQCLCNLFYEDENDRFHDMQSRPFLVYRCKNSLYTICLLSSKVSVTNAQFLCIIPQTHA